MHAGSAHVPGSRKMFAQNIDQERMAEQKVILRANTESFPDDSHRCPAPLPDTDGSCPGAGATHPQGSAPYARRRADHSRSEVRLVLGRPGRGRGVRGRRMGRWRRSRSPSRLACSPAPVPPGRPAVPLAHFAGALLAFPSLAPTPLLRIRRPITSRLSGPSVRRTKDDRRRRIECPETRARRGEGRHLRSLHSRGSGDLRSGLGRGRETRAQQHGRWTG
jgi:hypothetical protein